MAKTHQRVFALVLALMFLATSVATGAIVVWQIKKENQQTSNLSDELSAKPGESSLNKDETKKEGNMLQGTKLENFDPLSSVSELKIIDLQVGTGEEAKTESTVTAHYTGALASDGTIFQSSLDGGKPAQFPLNQVIQGWTLGVPGMKVGGKRRLIIPYAMAYGDEGRPDGGIPAKADLVFDIELVSIP